MLFTSKSGAIASNQLCYENRHDNGKKKNYDSVRATRVNIVIIIIIIIILTNKQYSRTHRQTIVHTRYVRYTTIMIIARDTDEKESRSTIIHAVRPV